MEHQSNRFEVYRCDQFCIELEYNSDYVIWHTKDVQNFNRVAFRKMKEFSDGLEKFLSLHYSYLYTAMDPARDDLARLAKHGGFIFHSHVDGLDLYQKPLKGE